jgi:hypothetical protein
MAPIFLASTYRTPTASAGVQILPGGSCVMIDRRCELGTDAADRRTWEVDTRKPTMKRASVPGSTRAVEADLGLTFVLRGSRGYSLCNLRDS